MKENEILEKILIMTFSCSKFRAEQKFKIIKKLSVP